LQSLPSGESEVFNPQAQQQWESLGLNPRTFIEMVLTMVEELYVRLDDQNAHLLVGRLRGESGAGRFSDSSHLEGVILHSAEVLLTNNML
jgi:hypothetical protein